MTGCISWGPCLSDCHMSLLGDTSYQVMMLSSPTLAFLFTQIHQVINLKESEKALFWRRIWKIIREGMMFWKHIALCKDCSSYFSSFVAGLHSPLSIIIENQMFRLSQNFLCTFMTWSLHTLWLHVCKGNSIFLALSSSARTFPLFDCSFIPFHILVCLFSIYFSDVALFCGFYSRRATLWPLRTYFVLPHSVNFPRVHWRLMAGSGILLDPLWRKVLKSISQAYMYLGSAESFEGNCTPVPFNPSWAQLLKHPTWALAWLSHVGKESVNPCPCSNNLSVHWQVEQGFSFTELLSPFYPHHSFTRVLVILVIT